MPVIDVIRAWKDEDFRAGLTEAQLSLLPAHPSGAIEFHESAYETGSIGHGHTAHCTRACTRNCSQCGSL